MADLKTITVSLPTGTRDLLDKHMAVRGLGGEKVSRSQVVIEALLDHLQDSHAASLDRLQTLTSEVTDGQAAVADLIDGTIDEMPDPWDV